MLKNGDLLMISAGAGWLTERNITEERAFNEGKKIIFSLEQNFFCTIS